MVQYKDTNKIPQLGGQIASVYEAFTKIVDEDDSRVRTIHVNLAETLFAIREFNSAATQYRWILSHGSWSESEKTPKSVTGGITVPQASLRAIAARYEALRQRNLVPGELTAKAAPQADRGNLDGQVKEWVSWIDQHADEAGMGGLDNFVFEANRVLYSQGQINLALERLNRFALKYPASKFAVPSASLVMDTVIASARSNGKWDEVVKTADTYIAVSEWAKSPFGKRVYAIAADSQFKLAESLASRKDHAGAIEQSKRLLSRYGSHDRAIDAMAVAANAAMAMNQRDQAISFYSQLAARPEKDVSLPALKTIAKIEEERFALGAAAQAHQNYLARAQLTSGDAQALRRRILSLAWMGGDASQLSQLLSQKPYCTGSLRADCERYGALVQLMGSKPSASVAFRNANKAPAHVRAIWATAALESFEQLLPGQRHQMIGVLAKHWPQTEAMAKFSLAPRLTKSIPKVFATDRELIRRSSQLVADERVILKRINQIRTMEEAAAVAARLPWTETRGLVLTQVGGSYEDLASGLKDLPAPKGLSKAEQKTYEQMVAKLARPFEQKAQTVRSQSRALLASSKTSLDASDLGWSGANYNTGTKEEIFRARWKQALSSQNWPMVAYFIQEAEKKGLLNRNELSNAKAVSLAVATNSEGS